MRINNSLPPKFFCEIVMHIAPPCIWFKGIMIFDFYNTRFEWEKTNKKANLKIKNKN